MFAREPSADAIARTTCVIVVQSDVLPAPPCSVGPTNVPRPESLSRAISAAGGRASLSRSTAPSSSCRATSRARAIQSTEAASLQSPDGRTDTAVDISFLLIQINSIGLLYFTAFDDAWAAADGVRF